MDDNLRKSGQYLLAMDGNTPRLVQCDADGKLLVSSSGGSGSSDVNITNQALTSVSLVAPSNSATFPPTRGVYIGGFGDLVATINGVDITLVNLAIGVWHPISITAIKVTGTTATNILLGY